MILEAEASKEAAILKAEAEKQKRIREAEGQAEAIRTVQKATAEGIEFVKAAGADQAVLTLKSLEAFVRRRTARLQRSSSRPSCRGSQG